MKVSSHFPELCTHLPIYPLMYNIWGDARPWTTLSTWWVSSAFLILFIYYLLQEASYDSSSSCGSQTMKSAVTSQQRELYLHCPLPPKSHTVISHCCVLLIHTSSFICLIVFSTCAQVFFWPAFRILVGLRNHIKTEPWSVTCPASTSLLVLFLQPMDL